MIDTGLIYDSELADIPDLNIYRMRLAALRKIDMSSFSIDAIQRVFMQFASVCPNTYGYFTPEKFNYHKFYRVRVNIDSKSEDLEKAYSYPPIHLCKANGRANMKDKAVFYCSNEAWAAIYEAKPKVGDICHLSIWTPKANRNVKFGIALSKKMGKDNIWRMMAEDAYEFAKQHAREHGQNKAAQLEELFEFLADQFLLEKEPYPLTSWLADNILYSDHKNDFLLYPSIETRGKFCNMAFLPDSADTLLNLEKVVTFIVRNISHDDLGVGTGKVGEFTGGKVQWHHAGQNELNKYISNGEEV